MPKSPDDLEALGATVMWVRQENGPVTTTRPEGLLETARGALAERGVTDARLRAKERRHLQRLRGLSGAINAVADEVLKRSEATLVRDRRHEMRVEALETAIGTLRDELAVLQRRGRDDA